MDRNLMAMTGGRERKASEFDGLLEAAGFRLDKVTQTPTFPSIIEADSV